MMKMCSPRPRTARPCESRLREIRRPILCLAFCLGLLPGGPRPAAAYTAKGVGVVTALRGQVAVAHASEVAAREGIPAQEALRFRSDVFFRDVIDTQRESTAKVLLRGRSTLTIRELSRVELREGAVPADPSKTRSIVSLLAGKLRAIVAGDLLRGEEVELRTPNAISAVRGTDVLWLFEAGRTTGVVLRGVLEAFNPTQVPPPPTVVTVPAGNMLIIQGTDAPIVQPIGPGLIDQLLADLRIDLLVRPPTPADETHRQAQVGLALGWAGGYVAGGFGLPQGCGPLSCVTSGSGVISTTGLAASAPTIATSSFQTTYFLSSLDVPFFAGFLSGPQGGAFVSSLSAGTIVVFGGTPPLGGSGIADVQISGVLRGWPPRGNLVIRFTGINPQTFDTFDAVFSGLFIYNGRWLRGSFSGTFLADTCGGDGCTAKGLLSGMVRRR